MTTTDYAIAREAITNVRWSTDLDRITPAIGNLANVSLSTEEVERLKLKDFLECCVTRGLLRQLYANMILHRVQRPKEVKKPKKGRESSLLKKTLSLKKTIVKRIQKKQTNYVCVKVPPKKTPEEQLAEDIAKESKEASDRIASLYNLSRA
uniref:40S ribosomal protein S6 n=1 Tax=Steinernema glaseri TaxID=37863 RepID=A0A1I7Z257_9BILA